MGKASIYNALATASIEILGIRVERPDWRVWKEDLQPIVKVFGESQVEAAFREWAESRAGDQIEYPVSEFSKVAIGMLRGVIVVKASPETDALANDLVYESGGVIAFDAQQKIALGKLLGTYPLAEIVKAFRTFYGEKKDDYNIGRTGAKQFIEKASQYIESARRAVKEAQQTEALIEQTKKFLQHKAQQEQESREAAAREEAELVEEDPFRV